MHDNKNLRLIIYIVISVSVISLAANIYLLTGSADSAPPPATVEFQSLDIPISIKVGQYVGEAVAPDSTRIPVIVASSRPRIHLQRFEMDGLSVESRTRIAGCIRSTPFCHGSSLPNERHRIRSEPSTHQRRVGEVD